MPRGSSTSRFRRSLWAGNAGLSVYDACYVVLAEQAGAPLLTADRRLAAVAPAKHPARLMELTSSAFADGGPIPVRHTCDGEDVSPPLAWTAPPDGTVALALCVDDPDAGRYTFTHLLAWGLAPAAGSLAEGEAAPQEGRNDFGAQGYRGPCPPFGRPHRYVFRLLALDADPALGPSDRRRSFDAAVEGHVLATAELTGRYER